jgi:four helix bundle protein
LREFDYDRNAARRYGVAMQAFEQLDAYKVCHELALRSYRVAKQLDERDPELAAQLWSAALVASSRIVRGAAFRNRRMFGLCLDRALGALSEVGYHVTTARTLDLLSETTASELESLRGRAVFYTTKLLIGLHRDPEGGTHPPG